MVLALDVAMGGGAQEIPIGLANMYITPIRFWFGTGLLLLVHVEMVSGVTSGNVVSCAFRGARPDGFAAITGSPTSEKGDIQSLGIPNDSGRRGYVHLSHVGCYWKGRFGATGWDFLYILAILSLFATRIRDPKHRALKRSATASRVNFNNIRTRRTFLVKSRNFLSRR